MFLLMSLESVSTLELQKEIDECLDSHSNLLDYSKQPGTLILPAEQPPVQMEQPQPVYSWSDDARAAINDHQAYHTNMVTFLNQMSVTGPPEKFPTQPKSKLKDLIMKKKTKTRKRTPEELHAYLQRNIVNVNKKFNKDVFNFSVEEIKTPAEAMVKLREGYKHIQRQNAQTLLFFIQYGKLLNATFQQHEQARIRGETSVTWGKWLSENIGIHPSYSRKLREIATLLEHYPLFLTVGLFFNEIYGLKKEIKELLERLADDCVDKGYGVLYGSGLATAINMSTVVKINNFINNLPFDVLRLDVLVIHWCLYGFLFGSGLATAINMSTVVKINNFINNLPFDVLRLDVLVIHWCLYGFLFGSGLATELNMSTVVKINNFINNLPFDVLRLDVLVIHWCLYGFLFGSGLATALNMSTVVKNRFLF